jgi:hypothetical protein
LFEQFWTGTLEELEIALHKETIQVKGEFVI